MTDARPATPTWAATALVATATAAAAWALSPVVIAQRWPRDTVVALLVVAAVVIVTRLLVAPDGLRSGRARLIVPTLLGTLVAAWLVLARYAGPAGRTDPYVGLDSLDRAGDRITSAFRAFGDSVAPVSPTVPIDLVVVGASLAIFLVADLVAVVLRRPALAGLPVLLLWTPALVLTGAIPTLSFIGTTSCLILLLATRRTRPAGTGTARAIGVTTATAAAAGVTALALVAGTASAALPPLIASSWSDAFTDPGTGMRLSDDLDMQRDLQARSTVPVLSYRLSDPESYDGTLRVYTLTSFDGTRWNRDDRAAGNEFGPADLLWSERAEPDDDPVSLTVTLAGYRDSVAPIPLEPRTVDIDGTWAYERRSDEIRGKDDSAPDLEYDIAISPRDLSPALLGSSRGADPTDSRYLDVPQTTHAEDVTAAAEAITADAPTRYDKAVALQDYFRDTSSFTYDTSVAPSTSDDSVWDFLSSRSGYCVQFATSMTVMARSIGIPARVGVGYLPGRREPGGSFIVTAQRAHAWPELYFPGSGWVRFEPTPSQRTGAAPDYTLDGARQGPAADPVPAELPIQPGQAIPETNAPVDANPAVATAPASRDETPWTLWLILAALVGTAGLVASVFVVVRVRRRKPADRTVDDVWRELRSRLARDGIGWSDATTPRQAPAEVARAVEGLPDHGMTDDAIEALNELASAVEADRYAPTGTDRSPEELAMLADRVVDGLRIEKKIPARA